MNITIRDIERIKEEVSSLDNLEEKDFEFGRDCKEIKNVVTQLELSIAFKKLDKQERKIADMIEFGYSQREIAKELKVSSKTIRKTLDKIRDIIK